MNILIRTDCSNTIGMGHLMRCIALAEVLKEKGAEVIFVLRNLVGNRIETLQKKGLKIYQLSSNHPFSYEEDAIKTIEIIKQINLQFHWIIVDHYEIDAQWQLLLRNYTQRLMVIDDIANRPHECDMLLDQNYYSNQLTRYTNLISKNTQLLLGPEFALLRKDFHHYRAKIKRGNSEIKKLLIFFGGGDCSEATIKTFQTCLKLQNKNLTLDVVVSNACSKQEEIKKMCHISNARYFCQVDNMAELMAEADFAIGAGGSSIWERCCLGLPSIVLTIAENQIAVAQAASSLGVLKYLDEINKVRKSDLAAALTILLDNPQALKDMSIKASSLVDGLGCERVVEQLYGN